MFHAVALSYANLHNQPEIYSHKFLRNVVAEQWKVISTKSEELEENEITMLDMLFKETPLFKEIPKPDNSKPSAFSKHTVNQARYESVAALGALPLNKKIMKRAEEILKEGEFGIELELGMLESYLDVHIDVFTWNPGTKKIINSRTPSDDAKDRKTTIAVAHNNEHYFGIVDKTFLSILNLN
jgi:hypothetical protein